MTVTAVIFYSRNVYKKLIIFPAHLSFFSVIHYRSENFSQGGFIMKKKLLALALGITTALSAMPVMTSQALEPPIPGDVNLDWTINIADLVCMQNYLLGNGTVNTSQFGLVTVDLNHDNSVDVFDYIELKKLVDEWCGISKNNVKIESRFTQVDTSIPPGVIYSRPSGSASIIRSVDDLENYLSPFSVITTGGDCVFIDSASQEVLDDLYARYDEDFFSKNVLLLNYLPGTAGYEFESIKYEGDRLVIKYYDTTPYGLHWAAPLPPYIAEVAIPETLWADCDFDWEEVDPPSEMTVKSDFTNAVTDNAITSSYSAPSVVTNPDELNAYLDGRFNTGVEMSLKETYNDAFFESNVVIFDSYYQGYREDWETSVSVGKDEYDNIVLTYDRQFINGFVDEGLQINQVVIPKEQYNGETVLKEKTWETPVDVMYRECDLWTIAEMAEIKQTEDAIKCLDKEGAWVNSDAEMRAYLSECVSDELLEFMFPDELTDETPAVTPDLYNPYAINWNNQSVYMWVDSNIIGSTKELIYSACDDEQLTLMTSPDDTIGCEASSFLHIVRTDKEQSGKTVVEKSLPTNQGLPHTDGECMFMQFGKYIVMVNQYTFGNKNVADIYRVYPRGIVLYGASDYIGTVEFADGYFPVKSDSDFISYGQGDNVIMSAGEYSVTMNDEQLTFKYKYSADSEYTEKTFNYSRNYY